MRFPARQLSWLTRLIIKKFNYLGILVGFLFFLASLTPSLLPRPWFLQGMISGLVILIGYGLGTFISFAWRKFVHAELPLVAKKIFWIVLFVAGSIVTAFQLKLSIEWQRELYRVMDLPVPNDNFVLSSLAIVVVAFLMSYLVVLLLRVFGFSVRSVYDFFNKRKLLLHLPLRLRRILSVVLTCVIILGFVTNIAPNMLLRMADGVFSSRNDDLDPRYTKPTSSFLSGSDESLVSWQSLGRQGRAFIGSGPTVGQISEFNHGISDSNQTVQPIRVYVGMDFSNNIHEQARIAIKELERTNAFSRKAILVVTTTGSGWVDSKSVKALEYIYDGDIATVTLQYSYLPSWLSFLSDKSRAKNASSELISSVKNSFKLLKADNKPKLFIFGESLGSYGVESSSVSANELALETDGVVLVGPPGFNPLHNQLTKSRVVGSPQYQPIYDGLPKTNFVADINKPYAAELSESTSAGQIVYLQNPSDPVSKWNTDLLFNEPGWVKEEKIAGLISSKFKWYPVVSFSQITFDMVFAMKAPVGYGHNYGARAAEAWLALTGNSNWDDSKVQALTKIMDTL